MIFIPEAGMLVSMFNMGPLRLNRPGQPDQNRFGGFDEAPAKERALNPVHVQTLTGKEVESEPGIEAHKEHICVFTRERLYAADDGEVADQIEYEGRCYKIVKVEDWRRHGGIWCSWAALEDGPFPEEDC